MGQQLQQRNKEEIKRSNRVVNVIGHLHGLGDCVACSFQVTPSQMQSSLNRLHREPYFTTSADDQKFVDQLEATIVHNINVNWYDSFPL
jgi:hypothetical protein